LFDTFAKEFFTKKQFMLSTSSLQTLVDISRHGTFNKTLKHVIIGLECFKATSVWASSMSEAQRDVFRIGSADQFALMSSGRDRTLLAEAFRNLPSLDTVGIRDYDASGRVRDDNRWSSYGAPSISRQMGVDLRIGPNKLASQAFLLLMQALADAERPVPSIETILRSYQAGLTDFSFFLPSQNSGLDVVLGGLRRLFLTLSPFGESSQNSTTSSLCLESFLLQTLSLDHLRMNFWKSNRSLAPTSAQSVLQRLSTTPNLLPVIRRLDLGMMSISPVTLVQVISRFSTTLRHVSLWKIELQADSATRWKDSQDRYSPWPRALQDLSSTTSLTSMSLGCLGQKHGSVTVHIEFSDGKIAQDYSGEMKVWIHQLLDDLKISWPDPRPPYVSSSDDDIVDGDEFTEDEPMLSN
jgi:hypothetical protein